MYLGIKIGKFLQYISASGIIKDKVCVLQVQRGTERQVEYGD